MGARIRYIKERKRWQARVTHRGRRIAKDFAERAQALAWASATFGALALGKPIEDAGRQPLSLSAWCQQFLKKYSTNQRDAVSLRPVVAAFGTRRLDTVAEWHVKRYVADRRAAGIGNKTINHEVTALRHALYVAVTVGVLDSRPAIEWHSILLPTLPRNRVLTDAEVHAIREHLPQWVRDAFDLALLTGLRWGDLSNLTRENIDLDRGVLMVKQRKNARPLEVPLVPAARAIVDRAMANLDTCGYLLANTQGNRLRKVREQWLAAVKAAQVKGATWHDLRHTFATRLVHAGVSDRVLASMIGDTPMVARLYATVSLAHKREMLEKACATGVPDLSGNQRIPAANTERKNSVENG